MIKTVDFTINELNYMKKYPKELFYKGNLKLLNKRKISMVGTRHPNKYATQITYKIAKELAKRDIIIVSGAAIGIDAIAHKGAGKKNTIAIMANGLDIKYPAINSNLIQEIEEQGLVLSSYKQGQKARNYTFVQRNEIVVSLGEILIVSQADENSGTLSSINYALNMGKKVYTIPHHLGQSIGTQKLLAKEQIQVIYDLDEFLNSFGEKKELEDSKLLSYLKTFPSYDEAILKYQNKIFELELEGKIKIKNGQITLL